MEKEEERDAGVQNLSGAGAGARHIKKRALRNKALSVSFNDKDLKDYVTGFHKRKKKRRKEAQRQVEEKERLIRIQQRKKRKLEKELALCGGVLPEDRLPRAGSRPDECDADLKDDCEQSMPVSGTKVYDIGETTITVTTSEISREDENDVGLPKFVSCSGSEVEPKYSLPAKKKPMKKVAKRRPRKKQEKFVLKKKGKKKGNRR